MLNKSNAERSLWKATSSNFIELYGDNPPSNVKNRFDSEWRFTSGNGYALILEAARQIVLDSKKNGYRVEIISTLGSSFIAFLAGITESNPLPPHYHCLNCKTAVFPEGRFSSPFGSDLKDKKCPVCGEKMNKDGYTNSPEMIWGLRGDKSPHVVFRITEDNLKNAVDAVSRFFHEERIICGNETTVIQMIKNTSISGSPSYQPGTAADSSPISIDPVMLRKSDGLFCLHFFPYYIDEVGSVGIDPWQYFSPHSIEALYFVTNDTESLAELEKMEHTSKLRSETMDFNDKGAFAYVPAIVLSRFARDTSKAEGVLSYLKPGSFSDLVRVEGLINSVGLWEDNEDGLLAEGLMYRDEMVTCREDVIRYLTKKGVTFNDAYKIADAARKGRFDSHRNNAYWTDLMYEHGVAKHYIELLGKASWLCSVSAAIHMALTDYRLALYKAHAANTEVE